MVGGSTSVRGLFDDSSECAVSRSAAKHRRRLLRLAVIRACVRRFVRRQRMRRSAPLLWFCGLWRRCPVVCYAPLRSSALLLWSATAAAVCPAAWGVGGFQGVGGGGVTPPNIPKNKKALPEKFRKNKKGPVFLTGDHAKAKWGFRFIGETNSFLGNQTLC